jgi:glutamine amidotransferase
MSDYNIIKIGIIDLKINNLYSIYNSFQKIGYKTKIIKNNKNLDNHDFIVLPGVGAFKEGMNALKKNNLIDVLKEKVIVKKKKIIGICLGMQMLFAESNERGVNKGLNFIKGNVRMFKKKKDFSIPVIGWYKTRSLVKQLNDKYFYHIHSYYCNPIDKKSILSETTYQNFSYCSSIQSKNILAFQFHPEKSGINGINLLKKIPQLFK